MPLGAEQSQGDNRTLPVIPGWTRPDVTPGRFGD